MQNANRNVWITLAAVLAVIILVGAYLLFQGKSALPVPGNIASSTGPGPGAVITTPTGSQGGFGVVIDTSSLVLGGTIPPIQVTLPANSNGKFLVFALKPLAATSSIATEILLSTPVNTTGTAYHVSGLKLETYLDGTTGKQHVPITHGMYEIEAVLWDKNPLFADGKYGNFAGGNNATAVLSGQFTL